MSSPDAWSSIPARTYTRRSPLALDEAALIGRGSGRACFEHPHDPALCLKVPFNARGRKESRREHGYLRRVARRYGDDIHTNVARVHGTLWSDRGRAWIVERVRDEPSGAASPLLVDTLTREALERERASWRDAFDDLVRWASRSGVVIRDWSSTNLCVRRLADGRRRLVLIDGIGPKEAVPLWLPIRAHARARNRYYAARRGLDSVDGLLALCERERARRDVPSAEDG